jgi:hypothetical protein
MPAETTEAESGHPGATFCFISSRLFETDFRKPLIDALHTKGCEVWHVRVGRRNILTKPNTQKWEFNGARGFLALIRHINRARTNWTSPLVFVDTTGAFVPLRSVMLRFLLGGLWCFDIFDNLLYDAHGLNRFKRSVQIALLAHLSPIQIVLSKDALRLFPKAYHLDNAAHTTRYIRPLDAYRDLVSLFAIDERFDFELVRRVAELAPDLKIHLYGRVASNDPSIRGEFEKLRARYPNLTYHGEYRFADVDVILATFGIGFTPYVTSCQLTDFINPDKYYLFLKSGMEVISTDIPQARRLKDRIHIAHSADEILALASQIKTDASFRKNKEGGNEFDWAKRADELIRLVRSKASWLDRGLLSSHVRTTKSVGLRRTEG